MFCWFCLISFAWLGFLFAVFKRCLGCVVCVSLLWGLIVIYLRMIVLIVL